MAANISRRSRPQRSRVPPSCPSVATRKGKAAFGFLDRHVDPHIDLVVRLDERHVLALVVVSIEVLRTAEGDGAEIEVRHSVEAERSQRLPRQAMAEQVPAPVRVITAYGSICRCEVAPA